MLSVWATGTMYMNFGEKHSPNVLENQTRFQNSAYTTRKNLIFHVLCALFEQIPSGINWDIKKNPTWCGAKNSNKLCAPSYLVTWIPHTVYVIPELCAIPEPLSQLNISIVSTFLASSGLIYATNFEEVGGAYYCLVIHPSVYSSLWLFVRLFLWARYVHNYFELESWNLWAVLVQTKRSSDWLLKIKKNWINFVWVMTISNFGTLYGQECFTNTFVDLIHTLLQAWKIDLITCDSLFNLKFVP